MPGSDQADWSEIRRLYVAGEVTITSIATQHGVTAQRIARRARMEGWPSRRQHRKRKRDGSKAKSARKPIAAQKRRDTAAGKPHRRLPANPAAQSLKARRTLVCRLYKAIDTKLQHMEHRMAHDMATDEHPSETSAADHERDTRAIGTLIANLSRVTEIEADLERIPGTAAANATEQADRQLADEAERFRREVAVRLARIVRPA